MWNELSIFQMQAERGDNHRPAIFVVPRIDDVLQSRSHVNAAPDMGGVVSFKDIFAPIIQRSVPDDKAVAAMGKVALMIF